MIHTFKYTYSNNDMIYDILFIIRCIIAINTVNLVWLYLNIMHVLRSLIVPKTANVRSPQKNKGLLAVVLVLTFSQDRSTPFWRFAVANHFFLFFDHNLLITIALFWETELKAKCIKYVLL